VFRFKEKIFGQDMGQAWARRTESWKEKNKVPAQIGKRRFEISKKSLKYKALAQDLSERVKKWNTTGLKSIEGSQAKESRLEKPKSRNSSRQSENLTNVRRKSSYLRAKKRMLRESEQIESTKSPTSKKAWSKSESRRTKKAQRVVRKPASTLPKSRKNLLKIRA